jgi:hypothetical protein
MYGFESLKSELTVAMKPLIQASMSIVGVEFASVSRSYPK